MPGTVADSVRLLRSFFLAKNEDNTVQGHLYPAEDSTYDLGSIGLRWRYGYYNNLYADTLTVQQIRGISIRPNFLRNGSFEQSDQSHLNQPLGWRSNREARSLEVVHSILDDANFPVDEPEAPSLTLLGAM